MKNPQNTYTHLLGEIKKFVTQANHKKVVLGVSGGADSALVLKLMADAIGPEKVTALIMPENGVTKDENTYHAKALCKFLKVQYNTIPINKYLLDLLQLPWQPSRLAQMNTKARARAQLLYNFANTNTALVVGTSNKSEIKLGYGTKFGDMACDFMPIGDLYKTEVVSLSEHLGLPDEIVHKTPTAELYNGQTDEDELGLSYKQIDKIFKLLEDKTTAGSASAENEMIAELSEKGISEIRIRDILNRCKKNKHKSETPYIIVTGSRKAIQ
jgi:NAD+ synthase